MTAPRGEGRPNRAIVFLVPEKWNDNTPANTMRMAVEDTPDLDTVLFKSQIPTRRAAKQYAVHQQWGHRCTCASCNAFRRVAVGFLLGIHGGTEALLD